VLSIRPSPYDRPVNASIQVTPTNEYGNSLKGAPILKILKGF